MSQHNKQHHQAVLFMIIRANLTETCRRTANNNQGCIADGVFPESIFGVAREPARIRFVRLVQNQTAIKCHELIQLKNEY